MDINYSSLYTTAIPNISLSLVFWIFGLYLMSSISKILFLPLFNDFFSKPLVKIDIRALYMFLIYILLSFIYTFLSIPILDFILSNCDPKIYLKISMIFGISLTGILRIFSTKEYKKDVSFIIYLQIIITLIALAIIYNFVYKGSNYFVILHDEFLHIIEWGSFKDIFYFLLFLFVYVECIIKKIPQEKKTGGRFSV